MRRKHKRAANAVRPTLISAIGAWVAAALLTAAPAMSQSQATRRLSADIPAEPLPQALRAFAEQTGMRIVYVAAVVGEQRSAATAKGLESREALTHLLEGTGLRYEFLTATTVKIVASATQETDVAPSSLDAEEVVITARRTNESAWTDALSATTVTADELERSGIRGLDDLSVAVPGLSYSFARENGGVPVVRAMSGGSFYGPVANNVATVYDGIQISNTFAVDMTMLDLDRVEVLRGPQNALVGRNAFAGAILYSPARPTNEFRADALITAGSDGLLRSSAVASGPFSGRISGRLAAAYETFDGTIRNSADPKHNLGGWRQSAVSGSLQWQAEPLSVLLSGFWSHRRPDATPRFEVSEGNCGIDPTTGGVTNYCGPLPTPGSVDISPDARGLDSTTYFGRLELDWVWQALTLRSLTAYIDSRSDNAPDDGDNSSVGPLVPVSLATAPDVIVRYQHANVYYSGHPVDDHEWSEELRLTGSGQRARWLAGAYWADNHSLEHEGVATDARGLAPGEIIPPEYYPSTTPLSLLFYHQQSQHDEFFAVFGSLAYDLTSALEGSAELRWNQQRTTIPDSGRLATWALVTPRLTLAYALRWNAQVYASAARGARAGGFNGSPVPSEQQYGPESNWTYEFGFKLADGTRPLQATAAVFLADWSDAQLLQSSSDPNYFDPVTRNLGSARVTGLELAFDARPSRWSELHLSYAHTDARFNPGTVDMDIAGTCSPQLCHMIPGPQPGVLVPDVGGNRMPAAPLDAGSVRVVLHGDLPAAWRWRFDAGIDVIGREYVRTDNLNWLPARRLPNARLAVAGTRWEVALWGRYLGSQNGLEAAGWNPNLWSINVDRANGASWGLSLLYHTL